MNEAGARESWRAVGRAAGYIAGGAFLVGTVLYLLDATNALGVTNYQPTTRLTPVQNQANFWVADFAHQHHILWDIIGRDTLFPLAFVALVVLSLAVRAFVPADRPTGQLMVLFFLVGGVFAAVSDLLYLGATDYWRLTGWSDVPPVSMIAAGRSVEGINALTRWTEVAGFVVLAAGLVCLGNLCRSETALPALLAPLVYIEAALIVGTALAETMEAGTPQDVFSLLTGALVGPLVAIWLGHHLGRPSLTTQAAPSPLTAPPAL